MVYRFLVQASFILAMGLLPAPSVLAQEPSIDTLMEEIAKLHARIEKLEAENIQSTPVPVARGTSPRMKNPDTESLAFSGDVRVRYESTSAHATSPDRHRGVMRGRFGASYKPGDTITLATRIVTGDPDDPNSSDFTMGSFADDITPSIDQLYATYRQNQFKVTVGKFPLPFRRTDLVWDGDVNPFGASATFSYAPASNLTIQVGGIFSMVDEQIAESDSTMAGGELAIEFAPARDWQILASTALYDYSIGSLAGADDGDIRNNNLTPDGMALVSDFDLLNAIATIKYAGIGERWPLELTLESVRNLGARVPEDSGYSLELTAGNAAAIGTWRLKYGYVVAETDAVLAAFTHDNTTYSTNYRQHTVDIAFRPFNNTLAYLTVYLYDRKEDLSNSPGDDNAVRVRLNLHYLF